MSEQAPAQRRENLIRVVTAGVHLRAADNGDESPILYGHFARFNEWTRINSVWEGGPFMERFAPGAFRKTIQESRERMRVLFQHGMDPDVGEKPIAAITQLREDDEGAYYEASLFGGLPKLVMDGLRAGQYGASMQFGSMRQRQDNNPEPSDYNPDGIPERTVIEAKVPEFGPVTFPAYQGASAGVRSATDEFISRYVEQFPDELRAMLDQAHPLDGLEDEAEQDAPPEESGRRVQDTSSAPARRATRKATSNYHLTSRKEKPSWLIPSR